MKEAFAAMEKGLNSVTLVDINKMACVFWVYLSNLRNHFWYI